jgi:glycosyltransferase involved in cell wall biosynthesis
MTRPGTRHGEPAPTVSVVIPVKDDGAELGRCLRALRLQTRPVDEVVVVDNGSTDASADVARRFGARVVRCDAPGIPAASAAGYDAATGDLILRLDADCMPAATWTQAMTAAFARRPDVAAFSGGARFTDGPRALRVSLAALYLGTYTAVGMLALGHLPLFGSNLGLRRSAWRRVRSLVHRDDPEVHDDFDLAFHLGEHYRIGYATRAAMGISMRPFADARSFGRRLWRGARSVVVHWPHDLPPVRWTRLVLRRALRRREPEGSG